MFHNFFILFPVSLRSNKVAPQGSNTDLQIKDDGSINGDVVKRDGGDLGGDGDANGSEEQTVATVNSVTVPRTVGLVGGISFIVGTIIGKLYPLNIIILGL